MPTETAYKPLPRWLWPILFVAALAAVIFLSRRDVFGRGEPLVRDDNYNDTLNKADAIFTELKPAMDPDRPPLTDQQTAQLNQDAKLYESLVVLHPEKSGSYFALGRIYLALSDSEKAQERLKQSIDLASSDQNAQNFHSEEALIQWAHVYLSETYFRDRDWIKAFNEASIAIAAGTPPAEAYYARSQAEIQMGDLKSAKADIAEAIRLDPTRPLYSSTRKFIDDAFTGKK